MESPPPSLEIIPAATLALARRGIACILDGPESADRPADSAAKARWRNFENWCGLHGISLTRQMAALEGGRMVSACLWTQSPGRTALLYTTNIGRHPTARLATQACIAAVCRRAGEDGMVIAQTILDADNKASAEAFRAAAFFDLADLFYMERSAPFFSPRNDAPPGVSLWPYRPELDHVFASTIHETYRETLDCPRMAGLRSMTDVMAGHKAVGMFDPSLWSLVRRGEDWIGALLLSPHTDPPALELVYLGLVPAARRSGIGGFLMRHVLQVLSERRIGQSILAVDKANAPAVALYKKARYRITGERHVLILPLQSQGSGRL